MKIFCKSLCVLLLIPFLTLAIEPTNPQTICDRFVGEKDQLSCESKMKKDDVDWYAAAVCALNKDDAQFWVCWGKIKGVRFSPAQLDACSQNKDMQDIERISCLDKARLDRLPASSKSETGFQPLVIKREGK